MVHYMTLWDDPFNKIKNKSKKIEMRLNDERRKNIKVDDIIEFSNIKTNEVIQVKVIALYTYTSFKELYEAFDKEMLGYDKNENADYKDMLTYYNQEKIDKYGVLGIEIKLIEN